MIAISSIVQNTLLVTNSNVRIHGMCIQKRSCKLEFEKISITFECQLLTTVAYNAKKINSICKNVKMNQKLTLQKYTECRRPEVEVKTRHWLEKFLPTVTLTFDR